MKFVGLILAVLIAGCAMSASEKSYDISKFPKYDLEAVNAQWEKEVVPMDSKAAELGQLAALSQMYGIDLGEKVKTKIQKHYDEFIYWSAVTKVQVYHSDPAAKESHAKADAAMDKALDALKDAIMEKMAL